MLKDLRKEKPFKTLMTSFKNELRVYTTSSGMNDASIIHMISKNNPKINPKMLPNRFQIGSKWL